MAAGKPRPAKSGSNNPNSSMGTKVWLYSLLLTLQYGAQPLISKRFTRREVIVTSFILACELAKKQSIQQAGALLLLIIAAVLSIGEGSSNSSSTTNLDEIFFYGIIPVLMASILSSLAYALCQWASQVKKRTSYLMTVEMSIIGSLCLLASAYKSPDGMAIRQHGFFYGWAPLTWIPVIINAIGGILVGLVTTYAGGVHKFIFDGESPSPYYLMALPLVITIISIYQKYPYWVKKKES